MAENIELLVLDLIAFVDSETRSYDTVMDAWRTNCPRLIVWEEAVTRGFVACGQDREGASIVLPTAAGLDWLEQHGRRRRERDAA